MRTEQRFNRRSAPLLETQQPFVSHGGGNALGVCITLVPTQDVPDRMDIGSLRLHMTPREALQFATDLVDSARLHLRNTGKLE